MNPARLKRPKPLGTGNMLALATGVAIALAVSMSVRAIHWESGGAQAASQPNIVYIATDDMRYDDLNARYMPKTSALLADRGMTFEKAFVSTAWCCPSRAT